MVKLTIQDILAILRLFGHADDNTSSKEIDQIIRVAPDEQSTLVSFRFKKRRYSILIDHRVQDDTVYVQSIIAKNLAGVDGEVIENPKSPESFGMPYKGKDTYLFRQKNAKSRLDHELAVRYPDISRSTLQKYIKSGYVSVNDVVQVSTKHDVIDTDRISLSLPEKIDHTGQTLPIIYIDDDIVVIDKPNGMLTHSKGAMNDEYTVADFFRAYTTYNLDSDRPGVVHRLDRDTSGVMVGARHEQAAAHLQKQFANRTASKTYFAVVKGQPKNDKAIIDLPIGRNGKKPSEFRVDSKGKPAITEYEVAESNGTVSLVRLHPKTGRTHQLRVHMAYLGNPIIGDRVYGKASDRLYLHAHELQITTSFDQQQKEFTSPVPPEFYALLKDM